MRLLFRPYAKIMLAVTLATAPNLMHAQTPAQTEICNKFHSTLIERECFNLANDFTSKRAATTGLPFPSLDEPATDLDDLVPGIEVSTFKSLIESDAKEELNEALSPLLQTALNKATQLIETKAAVSQTGASTGATASTNLVTKPTSTGLISLAAESGAFTDTVNGNTITAQANVDGLGRFLAGRQFADLKPTAIDKLRHLNLTATFNIAQSGSTGVATSGTATAATPSIATVLLPANDVSFNSLSVNYALYRKYDPHSATFSKAWIKALSDPNTAAKITAALTTAEQAVDDLQSVRDTVNNNPKVAAARKQWGVAAAAEEKSKQPDFNRLVADYKTYLDVYVTALLAADTNSAHLIAVNNALNALEVVNEGVLDQARGTPLATLVYTYSTPASKPATHTATIVSSYLFGSDGNKHPFWDGVQLTANVSGS
jgi:hypothetical protein